jgi:hypothetical protein
MKVRYFILVIVIIMCAVIPIVLLTKTISPVYEAPINLFK